MSQLDLFPAPQQPERDFSPPGFVEGWVSRALRDLANGPIVYAFPGFMGAMCERLVARGFASREDAGFAPMPDFWPNTPAGRREWREREPSQQFTYTITAFGRAHLAAA